MSIERLPNGFSVPRMEYPFLSMLELLDKSNYTSFIKQFPKTRGYYIMQLEAEGNMAWSATKNWKQWVDTNKDLPAFKVTANVAPASAGASFTATLTSGSHTASKLSPIGEGFAFVDDSTNEEFEVVSVDKTTPGAHTVTLRNTNKLSAVGLTSAKSFLKYVGKPFTQEASYQRNGIYRDYDTVSYDMTILREDRSYSDSTQFEVLELDGKTYYNIDKDRLQEDFLMQQELELMLNGRVRDNVGDKAHGNQNTNHLSVLKQAEAKGLDLTATTSLSDTYFENIARQNDADGYINTYDVLTTIDFQIAFQKYLKAQNSVNVDIQITNGDMSDIQAVFDYSDRAKIYGVEYSIKKYDMLNSARTHGANSANSYHKGTALFIPKGTMYNPLENDYTPITRVRYQAKSASDSAVQTYVGGGLAGIGTTAELQTALVAHKGVEVGQVDAMKVGRIA